MKTYTKNWEWSGYAVRRTPAGMLVTFWSLVQGGWNARKILVKPWDTDSERRELDSKWNDWMTFGDYVAELAKEGGDKVIRTGERVQ